MDTLALHIKVYTLHVSHTHYKSKQAFTRKTTFVDPFQPPMVRPTIRGTPHARGHKRCTPEYHFYGAETVWIWLYNWRCSQPLTRADSAEIQK